MGQTGFCSLASIPAVDSAINVLQGGTLPHALCKSLCCTPLRTAESHAPEGGHLNTKHSYDLVPVDSSCLQRLLHQFPALKPHLQPPSRLASSLYLTPDTCWVKPVGHTCHLRCTLFS